MTTEEQTTAALAPRSTPLALLSHTRLTARLAGLDDDAIARPSTLLAAPETNTFCETRALSTHGGPAVTARRKQPWLKQRASSQCPTDGPAKRRGVVLEHVNVKRRTTDQQVECYPADRGTESRPSKRRFAGLAALALWSRIDRELAQLRARSTGSRATCHTPEGRSCRPFRRPAAAEGHTYMKARKSYAKSSGPTCEPSPRAHAGATGGDRRAFRVNHGASRMSSGCNGTARSVRQDATRNG